MIVGASLSLLEERTAACRECSSPVEVFQTDTCPRCKYQHSLNQLTSMKQEAKVEFIKSGVAALVFFPTLFVGIYFLNEKYAIISKCSCLMFKYGC